MAAVCDAMPQENKLQARGDKKAIGCRSPETAVSIAKLSFDVHFLGRSPNDGDTPAHAPDCATGSRNNALRNENGHSSCVVLPHGGTQNSAGFWLQAALDPCRDKDRKKGDAGRTGREYRECDQPG